MCQPRGGAAQVMGETRGALAAQALEGLLPHVRLAHVARERASLPRPVAAAAGAGSGTAVRPSLRSRRVGLTEMFAEI